MLPSLRVSRNDSLEMEEGRMGLQAWMGRGGQGVRKVVGAAPAAATTTTLPLRLHVPGEADRHGSIAVGGAVEPAS